MLGRRGPKPGTAIGIGREVVVNIDQARQHRLAGEVDRPRRNLSPGNDLDAGDPRTID
jgi:hypothetical protein